jgi:hypothetical protein
MPEANHAQEARRRLVQVGLGVVGLGLVTFLIRGAGPEKVARVLYGASFWLPFILVLEIAQAAADVVSLRVLLGPQKSRVPASTWLRSSGAAYAMMILLPAGRATGEVTRGALLSRHVGAAWAATAGAQLQASYLFANGALSAAAAVAVASLLGMGSPLALLLVGNAVLMAAISAGILAVLRGDRAGRWIEHVRQRFIRSTAHAPPLEPEARRRVPWRAAAVCTASRAVQVVQYGILLLAVGGAPSVRGALAAHGIHLVGATVGDILPNQLGVVDGAYRAFASAIGLGDAPARALSIAFVAHAAQLLCAAVCVIIATSMGRGATPQPEGPPSPDAGAHS